MRCPWGGREGKEDHAEGAWVGFGSRALCGRDHARSRVQVTLFDERVEQLDPRYRESTTSRAAGLSSSMEGEELCSYFSNFIDEK